MEDAAAEDRGGSKSQNECLRDAALSGCRGNEAAEEDQGTELQESERGREREGERGVKRRRQRANIEGRFFH